MRRNQSGAVVLFLGWLLAAAAGRASAAPADAGPRQLFDGGTLAGWETVEADRRWWTASDGMIVGGSLTEAVPRNTFLATRDSFQNFELTLRIRIRGAGGFVNSGVQIRSIRVPDSGEMKGYQVDAGDGWWGKLYDESRRNKVLAEPVDEKAVAAAVRPGDWNDYRIVAEGPRIRSWINGVPALDYVEADRTIPADGHVGIQVHGGGKALVEVREVVIRPLPPTPGAATWADGPLGAADELRRFSLPDGFTAELVVAERDGGDPQDSYGKFVAVAFDPRGRLWTMTAQEYPLDGNESPEASARLFATGGRDKVLVIDRPFGRTPSAPRVFADGLAIPLGLLPYGDGAIVQYGSEIRHYRDTDRDGRADGHDVLLTGFGTQDSHLFPHQFTRAPGGWILLAQGLFNSSLVRRPGDVPFADGTREVRFHACKLARFRADGSAFEPLTAGPNNIWGLTVSRDGEAWLQEANDLGFPIIPYEPGGRYPSGSGDVLRPYQPLMPPPLGPPQMGGTGLSGLALADDLDGWPAPWGAGPNASPEERIFYVANPITSSVQSIVATRNGERFSYRRGPDLLTCTDRSFRPVALQFGPDGCLYVVDWYNRIISHNEVPRSHPDRDRVRGRIWRIRHASQPVDEPVALADVATDDLPLHLGAGNARIADLAWQEIVDRRAVALVPRLEAVVADPAATSGARTGALWALEGLGAVTTQLLEKMLADATPALRRDGVSALRRDGVSALRRDAASALRRDAASALRREAVRIAGVQCDERVFRRLAAGLVDDPSPRVRAALGDAFRRIPVTEPATVELILELARGPATGDEWSVYDRDFERFLARWALERHRSVVAAYLDSPAGAARPLEQRALAASALEPRQAAVRLAALVPQLGRPLHAEEVRLLAAQADIPAVLAALEEASRGRAARDSVLRAILEARTGLNADALERFVAGKAADLWKDAGTTDDRRLALRLAGAFRLREFVPKVSALLEAPAATREERRAAIKCLREIGTVSGAAVASLLAAHPLDRQLRGEAVAAWAAARDPDAASSLVAAWEDLDFLERRAAAEGLARHREGARGLLDGVASGTIEAGSLPAAILADMAAVLEDDRRLDELRREIAGRSPCVLRLPGADAAAAGSVSLDGPFTVEAWVHLDPSIGREDSLLAADGVADMNFHDGRFRVFVAGRGDLVVARSPATPDTWTHYAVTRDAAGVMRIFVDGELDAESAQRDTSPYPGLRVGFSTPTGGGTRGRLAEFRVWRRDRTADEIRADFDRSFSVGERPDDLATLFAGSEWGPLSGGAAVEAAADAPALVTATEAADRRARFERFRALAESPGDPERGRAIFAARCLTCHQQGGRGGKVGPSLDGLGLTGVEAILRNLLTPSAAMEGGYRAFRVVTRDGRVVQGLLVSRDDEAIVVRQPDTADIRLATRDVARAEFTGVSIMPEGLLESLQPAEVSDLFAHLRSLGAPGGR